MNEESFQKFSNRGKNKPSGLGKKQQKRSPRNKTHRFSLTSFAIRAHIKPAVANLIYCIGLVGDNICVENNWRYIA